MTHWHGRYWNAWRDEQQEPSGVLRLVGLTGSPGAEALTLEQARDQLRLVAYGSPPTHHDDGWITDFGLGAAREACEQEVGLSFVPQEFEYSVRAFPVTTGHRLSTGMPRGGLRLPMAAPLRSVDAITYRDETTVTAEVLDVAAPDDPIALALTGTPVAISSLVITDSAAVPLTLVAGTDYSVDLTTGGGTLTTAPGTPPYLATYTYTADRELATTAYMVDAAAMPAVIYPAVGMSWPTTQAGIPRALTVRFTAGFDLPGASPLIAPLPYRALAAVRLMLTDLYENRGEEQSRNIPELPARVRNYLLRLSIDLGMA